MEYPNIEFKVGDVILDECPETYWIVMSMDERGCHIIPIKLDYKGCGVILSGVITSGLALNLSDHNKEMDEWHLSRVKKIYRWRSTPANIYSHGMIADAYHMLMYNTEDYCIYDLNK